MNISRKLGIAFSIIFLIVVAISILLFLSMQKLHKQQMRMEYSYTQHMIVQELYATVSQQIRELSDLLILGNEEIEEYRQARDEANQLFEHWKSMIINEIEFVEGDEKDEERLELAMHDELYALYSEIRKSGDEIVAWLEFPNPDGATPFELKEILEDKHSVDFLSLVNDVIRGETSEIDEIYKQNQQFTDSIEAITIALALFTLCAIVVVYFILVRTIAEPIVKLTHVVRDMGKGALDTRIDITSRDEIGRLAASFNTMAEDLGQSTASIEALNTEVAERLAAENKVESMLKEKELLLKEVHHRVKNNMQVIVSLLNLQLNAIDDENVTRLLSESQNRVRTMAMIHETLYNSESLSHVDLQQYLNDLVENLFIAFQTPPEISYEVDAPGMVLDIQQAAPCGLIVNELVTNSLKYAFPNGCPGRIQVKARQDEADRTEIRISDNGVGIPGDVDWQNTESLGLSLVVLLAKGQLRADIDLDRKEGTIFTIRFKPGIQLKTRQHENTGNTCG